jgi:hypothetical protein
LHRRAVLYRSTVTDPYPPEPPATAWLPQA